MRPVKALLYRTVCEHVSTFHLELVIKGEAPGRASANVLSGWRQRRTLAQQSPRDSTRETTSAQGVSPVAELAKEARTVHSGYPHLASRKGPLIPLTPSVAQGMLEAFQTGPYSSSAPGPCSLRLEETSSPPVSPAKSDPQSTITKVVSRPC